jgi:hypothetical protein
MEDEPLKQIPTAKPGNQVLRRLRKPRSKLYTACRRISRYLKGKSGRS